jgi:hypothetical protein
MDANKVRMFMLAAAGAVALATATSAVACEQCLSDNQHSGNSGICWDGFTTGGSCSGGQDGTWCTVGPQNCHDSTDNDATASCQYRQWFNPINSCS